MARKLNKKRHIYLLQRVVKANSLAEALKREKYGRLVEVVLVKPGNERLDSAIGFSYSAPVEDQD